MAAYLQGALDELFSTLSFLGLQNAEGEDAAFLKGLLQSPGALPAAQSVALAASCLTDPSGRPWPGLLTFYTNIRAPPGFFTLTFLAPKSAISLSKLLDDQEAQ